MVLRFICNLKFKTNVSVFSVWLRGIYWKGGFCYWTGSRAPGTWSFALVAAVAFYFNFRPQNEGKKCPRRQQQRQIYATLTAKSFQNAFCLRQRASSGWFWVVECHCGGVIKLQGKGANFPDGATQKTKHNSYELWSLRVWPNFWHILYTPHTHTHTLWKGGPEMRGVGWMAKTKALNLTRQNLCHFWMPSPQLLRQISVSSSVDSCIPTPQYTQGKCFNYPITKYS